jgi:hypothetical protein
VEAHAAGCGVNEPNRIIGGALAGDHLVAPPRTKGAGATAVTSEGTRKGKPLARVLIMACIGIMACFGVPIRAIISVRASDSGDKGVA